MKSSLLKIFFMSWLVSFLGVSFLLLLSGWIRGGMELLRVYYYAAPFWAACMYAPIIAVVFTLLYRVYEQRK